MKKIFIFIQALFISVNMIYAQNLVLNPSFETVSPCPVGPSELLNATDWTEPYLNLVGDTCSSSDLFNVCSPLGALGVGVPANILGNQFARTGDGYAGIIMYEGFAITGCTSIFGSGWREYLQGELSEPMIAGTEYCVSFYVSLADNVKWGSNDFGVYFSNTSTSISCATVGATSELPFTPQVTYSGPDLNDVSDWTLVQLNYIASGGERYFIIGNFNDDASTTYFCSNASAFNPYAYYYIDDVSVEEGACGLTCEVIPSIDVSACDPITNTYQLLFSVSVVNPPFTGTLNIEFDGVLFSSTEPFMTFMPIIIPDLPSDGLLHTFNFTMSDDPLCSTSISYLAPSSCASLCDIAFTNSFTNESCADLNDGAASVNVTSPSGVTYAWSHDPANTSNSANDLSPGSYTCTLTTSGTTPLPDQIIWEDDFDGALNWNLTNAIGAQGADANNWVIDDFESWDGVCGSGNLATIGDYTMHVYCAGGIFCTLTGTGAVYDAGGTPLTTTNTDKFSSTISSINTTGYTNIRVEFAYRCGGDPGNDYGNLRYSIDAGTTWIDLPTNYENQINWDCVSVALPASCENITSLKIAYRWRNNNDGIGTDPAFAIDDVVVLGDQTSSSSCSETVSFTINSASPITVNAGADQTICSGATTSVSASVTGGTGLLTYAWSPTISSGPSFSINPSATITFTLTVTDQNGCSESDEITINVSSASVLASINRNVCEAEFFDLNTLCDVDCTCSYYTDADLTISVADPSNVNEGTYYILCDKVDCDEIQPVVVSSIETINNVLNETICEGDAILVNAVTYTPSTDTIIINTYPTTLGCDSIVTSNIEVNFCGEIGICGGNIFEDNDGNGIVSCGDSIFSGVNILLSEMFDDANGNGTWDSAETYVDANANGIWDLYFIATTSNYPAPETFTDANGNCVYDVGEVFVDLNGNDLCDCINSYVFQDLELGDYVVSIDTTSLPTNFELTSPVSITSNLSSANNFITNLNFILPIELFYFNVNGDCASSTVSWKIHNSNEALNYALQMSVDGINFETVQEFENNVSTMEYTHRSNFSDDRYYRLAFQQLDGTKEYSMVKHIGLECEKQEIYIMPNPVLNTCNISFESNDSGRSALTLIDVTGKSIYYENCNITYGLNTFTIDMQSLASGIYYFGIKDLVNGRFDYYKISKVK